MYNEFKYEDISIGMSARFEVKIDNSLMEKFRDITKDVNPLHNDLDYALSMNFPSRVVYGMLSASMISTLAGVYLPGKYSLINNEEMFFIKPVLVGDILTIYGEVVEKNDKFRFIVLKVSIYNQNGIKVCRGKMEVSVLK